jgi:hypothetical protein
MLVLGGAVRGGKVYGRWPGLDRDQRFEGRDLQVTTDVRDVFGEIVVHHLGVSDPRPIFPGYNINASISRASCALEGTRRLRGGFSRTIRVHGSPGRKVHA